MPFFGFDRVMGCSRADLARWLAEFAGSDHGMAATGRADIPLDWGTLGVVAEPMAPRVIALARIQQLRVRFVYPDGAQEHARDWVTRFDKHTQRGGG